MVNISKISKVDWKGKWIWANYISPRRPFHEYNEREYYGNFKKEEMNVYCLFRREFSIGTLPKKAILNISADSRYKLFINGKYVGRGINRCEAYYWYYNTYDILEYLKPGKNVIAVHARFYGREFAFYTPPELAGLNRANSGKGGLIFEAALDYEGANKGGNFENEVYDAEKGILWIYSDANNTRVIRNIAENNDVPIKNDALGFVEEFDSRKMPKDWNKVDFDDSSWGRPIELDYPIKTLIYDENAPLFEKEYFPYEIIEIGETLDVRYMEEFDEEDLEEMDFCIMNMLEETPEPLKTFKINDEKNILANAEKNGNRGILEIEGTDEKQVFSIILRFEHEMVGYPRIIVEGPEGTIVDIISTEKFEGGRLGMDFLSQKRGSRLILRGEKQFFEQWDWEGFLFMQIKIRNLKGKLKIYKLATNVTHMRLRNEGVFTCSDQDLSKLFDVSKLTLLSCAIDGYLDCPSREQRSYLGDAYTESLIAMAAFGEPRLTKKLIYDTAFGQRKDGITFSFHPGDYQTQCHIIPDYCLYWIQIAEDYMRYFGERDIIEDLYPHFLKAIDWFWKYIDPKVGLLGENIPYWVFIDWSYGHEKPGYNAIINTQFMDTLFLMEKYADYIGDYRNKERFGNKARELKNLIEKTFWDNDKGCYRDYLKDGKLGGPISQHTNAYLVIKGVAPKNKWDLILENVFIAPGDENDEIQIENLREGHLKHNKSGVRFDPERNVLIAQPFFMHYVIRFFDLVGRHDLSFKYYRKGWVPMFKLGLTQTIWETWSKKGSECHAWAATPGFDLPSYILGVRPIEDKFKVFEIAPNIVDLDWANGRYPSPIGDINVSWKLSLVPNKTEKPETYKFELKFNVPSEAEAFIKLPNFPRLNKIRSVKFKPILDKKEVELYKEDGQTLRIEEFPMRKDDAERYGQIIGPLTNGNYKIICHISSED
ncbi:MAG: family 78 glycoside hydrolase catalytic domain [Promethearchaeota archaeon]